LSQWKTKENLGSFDHSLSLDRNSGANFLRTDLSDNVEEFRSSIRNIQS
jgi:hypothetical protein